MNEQRLTKILQMGSVHNAVEKSHCEFLSSSFAEHLRRARPLPGHKEPSRISACLQGVQPLKELSGEQKTGHQGFYGTQR